MHFRHIAAFCAAVPLFGCATFHDSRPVAQQQSDLRAATDALVGAYDVVDSRQNNRHFTSVVVRKSTSAYGPDVTMMNEASQAAVMRGSKKCLGYVVPARSYASVMCDAPAYGVNFYNLGSVTDLDRTVKDGGVIKMFPDMTVPPGDFLLEYAEDMNGRVHYLVLAKKTTS
jgi:hypothetical protein